MAMPPQVEGLQPLDGARAHPGWHSRLRTFGWALLELAAHTAGLIILLAFFRLIEKTIQVLWGTENITFFEFIRLKYIFQAADLFMLVGFLYISSRRFFKALKED
jgi:hypothetical protein